MITERLDLGPCHCRTFLSSYRHQPSVRKHIPLPQILAEEGCHWRAKTWGLPEGRALYRESGGAGEGMQT
jgi:hypothetical protein